MTRRSLGACLGVALLASLSLAPAGAAKPPDLPLDQKINVVPCPDANPYKDIVIQLQQADGLERVGVDFNAGLFPPPALEPAVRAGTLRTFTTSVLFAVHPLLSLIPLDDLVDDIVEQLPLTASADEYSIGMTLTNELQCLADKRKACAEECCANECARTCAAVRSCCANDRCSPSCGGTSAGGSEEAEPAREDQGGEMGCCVRRWLDEPVSLDFINTPLPVVLDCLRGNRTFPIVLDHAAVQADGADFTGPVSVRVERVPVKVALKLVLKQVGLSFVVHHGAVVLTSEGCAEGPCQGARLGEVACGQHAMACAPVCVRCPPRPSCGDGIDVQVEGLMRACHLALSAGQDATAAALAREAHALAPAVVEGDPMVYKLHLLAPKPIDAEPQSKVTADPKGCGRSNYPAKAKPAKGARKPCGAAKTVESKLSRWVSLNFKDTPLRVVLDDLTDCNGIQFVIDVPSLQEEGISLDSPVTLKLEDVSVKAALNLVLHQAHLDYVVKDEVVLISPLGRNRAKLVTATYQVADLVGVGVDPDALMKLLMTTVTPKSWAPAGPGAVDYFPMDQALVVNQAADVQEEIADLLAALRKCQQQEMDKAAEGQADECMAMAEDDCPFTFRSFAEVVNATDQAAEDAAEAVRDAFVPAGCIQIGLGVGGLRVYGNAAFRGGVFHLLLGKSSCALWVTPTQAE